MDDKYKLRAMKGAETRKLNKMFAAEFRRHKYWEWGDPIDLSIAEDIPARKVKSILGVIVI